MFTARYITPSEYGNSKHALSNKSSFCKSTLSSSFQPLVSSSHVIIPFYSQYPAPVRLRFHRGEDKRKLVERSCETRWEFSLKPRRAVLCSGDVCSGDELNGAKWNGEDLISPPLHIARTAIPHPSKPRFAPWYSKCHTI